MEWLFHLQRIIVPLLYYDDDFDDATDGDLLPASQIIKWILSKRPLVAHGMGQWQWQFMVTPPGQEGKTA